MKEPEQSTAYLYVSDIKRCPHYIIACEHYRTDGTCRCDDPTHREMVEWGYDWHDERWV